MPDKLERQIPDLLTTDQLARAHDVLVGELTTLRNQALTQNADPAKVADVFRRRAERLNSESIRMRAASVAAPTVGCVLPPAHYRTASRLKAAELEEGEYSVWW
jgi:hypothetical protein